MQSLKHPIVQACETELQQRVSALQLALNELSEAAAAESKSTAGDKHETGRAMIQLEQERLGKQLKEAEEQWQEFIKTDFIKSPSTIATGSLLETNKGWFLISVALGKMVVEQQTVFVISAQSPLGKQLVGAKQKDTVVFNSVSYIINAVY